MRAAEVARGILLAECARPDGPRGEIGKCPADDEAELAMREILLSAFPGWGFLGEETGVHDAAPGESCMWVVDPNDGTTTMQRGYRGHAISIGVVRDGLPILGVVWAVDAPDDRGDLFTWAEDCAPLTRNGIVVATPRWRSRLSPDDIVGVSQSANRNPVGYAHCVAPARFIGVPSIAYRLALVAAGDHVATLSLNPLRAWDYAGGHALIRAAGGVVLDALGNSVAYPAHGLGTPTRVFAGSPSVVGSLIHQQWEGVTRSGFGESEPPPDVYPIRPIPGRLVHDSGVLSRAQGSFLGQLLGDWAGGQPGPAGEEAILLARSLVMGTSQPAPSLASAAPLGICAAEQTGEVGLLAATLTRVIRDGLDAQTTVGFARDLAAARGVTIGDTLTRALSALVHDTTFGDPVSGALFGAVYGRDFFPRPLQQRVLSSRARGRPAHYWPTDLFAMIERLLTTEPGSGSLS